MRRLTAICLIAAGLAATIAARAADAVQPESVTMVNVRGEAQATVSQLEFYRGSSLVFTNCLLYSGTSTNTALQGLTGVAVELRIGTVEDSTAYAGLVTSTSGVWSAVVTVPTNLASAFVQVKITDANTNTFIYPWKTLYTRTPLD
jgi:hypothetical protein